MFICSFCKKVQPANTPSRLVPTHIRKVMYVFGANKTTYGFEPVIERRSCHICVPPEPIVVEPIKSIEAEYRPTKAQLEHLAALEEMSGEEAVAYMNLSEN